MIARVDRQRAQARRIMSLLERARKALLTHNVAEIQQTGRALDQAMDAFDPQAVKGDAGFDALLRKIRRAADRNCALAEGARRGVRLAREHANAAGAVRHGLGTYTMGGARQDVAFAAPLQDRRA